MLKQLVVGAVGLVGMGAAHARPIPSPIVGITLDDLSNLPAITQSLQSLARSPTVRIVLDEGVAAQDYLNAVTAISKVAYVMGEQLDSQYVNTLSVPDYAARVTDQLNTLGAVVDLWEIGNEVNGEWLGTTEDVVAKIHDAYRQTKARGYPTALTLYYNGESDDGTNSCWSDPAHEMFVWAQTNIPMDMLLGLDYVLISYYEDDCNGLQPDWTSVFQRLGQLFPNSKIGFGEIGTADRSHKSSYMSRYYSMRVPVQNYIGGYFWWQGREDLVPQTRPLWQLFNNTIGGN